MGKINKTDFFKKSMEKAGDPVQTTESQLTPEKADGCHPLPPVGVRLSSDLLEKVKEAALTLEEIQMQPLAREIALLYKNVKKEKFNIAVVGEFNRGKSTLINKTLGKEILPVGILPTTALLTRITFGKKNRILAIGDDGKVVKEMPLGKDAWDGLTAANFNENEPKGHVLVEVDDEWLKQYHVDILDTPGAGDLEEKRARVIERCLIGADAAVITLAATKMLSLTEQEFIKQKIMAKNIPFLAIALTHMDQISMEERPGVVSYLLKKLEQMNVSVPIFIADDNVCMPEGQFQDLVGFNRFRSIVLSWLTNKDRRELTEKWLVTNVNNVLATAAGILSQQKAIADAEGTKREELISERNLALTKVHEDWLKLREEMEMRCQKCVELFHAKAKECGDAITENLQHEADRMPNMKDWLEKEYAYRVKRELNGASITLDNFVMQILTRDIRWINNELSQQFKMVINMTPDSLNSREDFWPNVDDKVVRLENLKDKRTIATVVCSGVSLAAALLLGATGAGPVIIATMGVGTGANIISRMIIERKTENQRQTVKKLIAEQMPVVIKDATQDSEVKIKILYNEVIKEAFVTERRWMQAQKELIRQNTQPGPIEEKNKLMTKIGAIEELISTFKTL